MHENCLYVGGSVELPAQYGFGVTYLAAPGGHGAEFEDPVSVQIIRLIQCVGKMSSIMIYHTLRCKTLNSP